MAGRVTILTAPAHDLPLENESVDLIVTSPP
jgi:DNA modification methylase